MKIIIFSFSLFYKMKSHKENIKREKKMENNKKSYISEMVEVSEIESDGKREKKPEVVRATFEKWRE